MVLIDVPEAIASVFRLGEGLGEPAWRCEKTARGVYVNIRWSSNGATKPSGKTRPQALLNSRQRRSKRRLEEYLAKKASSSLAKAAGQPDEQPVSNTDIERERIADLPDEKSCHRPTTNCKIRSGEVPSFSISGIEKCPMPLDEGPFSLDAMISPTTIISRRPGPDHDPASGSRAPVQYTPDQVSCTPPSDERMSPEPAPTVVHQKPPNVYERKSACFVARRPQEHLRRIPIFPWTAARIREIQSWRWPQPEVMLKKNYCKMNIVTKFSKLSCFIY